MSEPSEQEAWQLLAQLVRLLSSELEVNRVGERGWANEWSDKFHQPNE